MKLFQGYYEVHTDGHEHIEDVLMVCPDKRSAYRYLKNYCKTFYDDEKPDWEDDRYFFPMSSVWVVPGGVSETNRDQWMRDHFEGALI